MRKVVVSGMIGNGLEWYDYALYGYFATTISKLFFPVGDAYVSLILTYGVFAAGFLMRPLGAVLFGWLGDKYGRKHTLAISIIMMAIPTTCIGLLPTYAQIGIAAPVLLTLIRLVQGLSLGGEFSGSITFMVEHSPKNRRGLVGSAAVFSLVVGMLLGSGTATLISFIMPPGDFEQWGWRVPFLLGIVIGYVGFYIRSRTEESPHYVKACKDKLLSKAPLKEVFTNYIGPMLQAIGIYFSVTVPFYIMTVFDNSYLIKTLGYTVSDALCITTISMFVLAALIPFSAHLSDKYGRKPVLAGTVVAMFFLNYPIFWLMTQGGFYYPLLGQCLFAMLVAFYTAPVPAVLVELFPTHVRYSGMAIAYNVCAALFGGTAPIVGFWLIEQTHINTVVAFYLMLCNVITMVTLFFYKDRYREELAE